MRAILFCVHPYAIGILKPLHDELHRRGHQPLWYVAPETLERFPFEDGTPHTTVIADLQAFRSDAIFVPGNEVPHYLRGVKAQVFHGLAGEKKGHFRIRHYFDLYLTQGPYFTRAFDALARRHVDFEVRETGWCKLDPLLAARSRHREERNALLALHHREALVLYAPTFSPSLTSAVAARDRIIELADRNDIYLLIKFHDLMDPAIVADYRQLTAARSNIEIVEEQDILRSLGMADLMVSDTSSVVYEFLLLDRPVITINSTSPNIGWRNIGSEAELQKAFREELSQDHCRNERKTIVDLYHPYSDGESSSRMVEAVEDFIRRKGVPESRKLSPYRRYLMNRMFGKPAGPPRGLATSERVAARTP